MKAVKNLRKWLPLSVVLSAILAACGGGGPESAPVFDPIVPQANFTTAAGPGFHAVTGTTAPLNCAGPADSTYQWVIESNGDLPIELSSATTAKSSFVAPAVSVPTNVSLACRMTVTRTIPASGNIAASTTSTTVVSNVVVTVDPPVAPTLVTTISGNKTAAPGTRLALTANTGWYDTKGAVTTGPVVDYFWTLGAGAPAGTIVTPASGSAFIEVVIPNQVLNVVSFPLTVTTVSGTKSSQATITVLVDPSGGVPLSVTPVAQTVQSGGVVSIAATKVGSLYYQWTIVNGPAVALGGASTNAVGFVAPTIPAAVAPAVASPISMTLRVAIGYAPITTDNPGIYFFDAVVTVKP